MLRPRECASVFAAVVLSSIVPFGDDVGAQQVSARTAADLVIEGVNVVDVREGRVVRDRTVVVDDGSQFEARRDAAYLIPGLWHMHTHLRRYAPSREPVCLHVLPT